MRHDSEAGQRSREVLAGWEPFRPPFAAVRRSLADAERHLFLAQTDGPVNRSREQWGRLQAAADDPGAAAVAVNDLLGAVMSGWRLRQTTEGVWRVHLVPAAGATAEELAAVQAVVLLIEAGGWSRLGRCAAPACTTVFFDITSGGNRRACRAHQRQR